MTFKVFLTEDATQDLTDIYDYIFAHDSPDKAKRVLNQIEKSFNRLSEFPDRGSYPKELSALGIKDYREVYFKPYRIIYRVIGKQVYVYYIADGRRELQTLLQHRLLGA